MLVKLFDLSRIIMLSILATYLAACGNQLDEVNKPFDKPLMVVHLSSELQTINSLYADKLRANLLINGIEFKLNINNNKIEYRWTVYPQNPLDIEVQFLLIENSREFPLVLANVQIFQYSFRENSDLLTILGENLKVNFDFDKDGLNNIQEIIVGKDPTIYDNTAENTPLVNVNAITPINGANNVSIFTSVNLRFTQMMDVNSISASTVIITENATEIPGTVTFDQSKLILKISPEVSWLPSATINVTLLPQIKDKFGRSIDGNTSFSFNTLEKVAPWSKAIRGASDKITRDRIMQVMPSNDGGYVLFGRTSSFGAGRDDIWVSKVDKNGKLQWQRAYGTVGFEDISSGVVLPNDDIVFIGNDPELKITWIVKLDRLGVEVWQKSLENAQIEDFLVLANGSLVMVGTVNQFAWVGEFAIDGSLSWNHSFNINGHVFTGILKSDNDNYYVRGQIVGSTSNGTMTWLVKLATAGDIIWQRKYFSAGDTVINDIKLDNGGNLLGVGVATSGFSENLLVVKLNENGAIVWKRQRPYVSNGIYTSVLPENDGTFRVAGTVESFAIIDKMSSTGDLVGQINVGGYNYDIFNDIERAYDGGFISVGMTGSLDAGIYNAWLYKFNIDSVVNFSPYSNLTINSFMLPTMDYSVIQVGAYNVTSSSLANIMLNNTSGILGSETNMLVENISGSINATIGNPTNLSAVSPSPGVLTLNWLDNAANESGYIIYQSTDGVNFLRDYLETTTANTTSYTVDRLISGTGYYYKVVAYNESGYSQYSNIIYVTVQ